MARILIEPAVACNSRLYQYICVGLQVSPRMEPV